MIKPPPRLSESEKNNLLFRAFNGFNGAAKLLAHGSTAKDNQAAMGSARRALAALSQLCADARHDEPAKPPAPRRLLMPGRHRPLLSLRKIGGAS